MPEPTSTDPNLLQQLVEWLWALLVPLLGYVGYRVREDRQKLERADQALAEKLDGKVGAETFKEAVTRFEKKADDLMGEIRSYAEKADGYHKDARMMIGKVHERIDTTRRELQGRIDQVARNHRSG